MKAENTKNTFNTMGKTSHKFSEIDILSYKPTLSNEYKQSGKDYINWGVDNKYPQYLYDIYCNCATLQSIINGSIDFTIGNDIILNIPLSERNQDGDTPEDVIKKAITDLWIFGGTAIQVIPNKLGNINEIVWLDIRNCRTDEDCKHVYYSKKWGEYGHKKEIKYDTFNPETLRRGEGSTSKVYFYKGNKTRGVYPICDYNAALVSAETQIEIQNFHYNTIINNFMVNGIFNFNNASNVSDEQKDEIERRINDKFSGTKNAARLMISWNEDKDKAVNFERITGDDFDNKYQVLSDSTRENLFISMRALPVLFGLTVQTGFNTQEYEEAFRLYNRTAIMPKQKEIVKIFDDIFEMENSISFIPFSLTKSNAPKTKEEKESNNELNIPEEILSDLTQDERRALVGYKPLNDENSNESIFAERLGVGGTEAFINVVSNEQLDEKQKKATLKILFNLSDEQINTLFPSNE